MDHPCYSSGAQRKRFCDRAGLSPTVHTLLNRYNCDHMDIQLGYALLRDRRVPIRPKLFALAIGAAVVGFTELLQIPLESLFAVILPIVGIAGDVALDGLEAIFGPVLIATLLLPYLAPDPVVQQIRAERARPV